MTSLGPELRPVLAGIASRVNWVVCSPFAEHGPGLPIGSARIPAGLSFV